mmetsp:Transcript_25175/g.70384  ORF Transcript_25175/g.70384 Transcript_25175/m.70384 type:complete len:129 (-) Transcript_25175:1053-1439(-)
MDGGEFGDSVKPSKCKEMSDYAFERSSFVKFMVEKLKEAGCHVDKDFSKVQYCDGNVGGGFAPGTGVILCHNHISTQDEVNRTLTHELIHAYDHCRGASLDWTDCDHLACSEVCGCQVYACLQCACIA